MRDFLEFAEAEKAASPFDRVDRAKYPRDNFLVGRILLQLDKVAVQLIQIFGAFYEEILD